MIAPPGAHSGHLMAMLEILARVQPVAGDRFPALLQEESLHLPWGSSLVIISGSQAEQLDRTLLALRQRGQAVALIVVAQDLPARLDASVPVHRVWTDADLVYTAEGGAGVHGRQP